MKPKAIIFTENNSEAHQMNGFLPKIFYFIYFLIYKVEVLLLIYIYKNRNRVILICTRDLFPNKPNFIDDIHYYDDLFRDEGFEGKGEAILNFSKKWFEYKPFNKIKNKLFFEKIFLADIVKTRFAIILAYSGIPIYWQSFEDIFSKEKPNKIILLSKFSKPEIIAKHLSKKNKIPCFYIPLGLTSIDLIIKKYLRYLDRKLRINEILDMSKKRETTLSNNDSKLLLVASMPMYLKSATPLINKLGKGRVMLLSSIYNTEQRLEELNQSISWDYLFKYIDKTKINQIIFDNFQKFKKIYDENITQIEMVPKNNIDLLFKLTKEELKLLFYSYFPQACAYIIAFEAFLRRQKIKKAIVFSDRGIFENIACQVCRRAKIKTIHITPNNVMSPDKSNEYNIADYITVPGEFMKQELVSIGRDPEKINVVGDLKLDEIGKHKLKEYKDKIIKKYSLAYDKKNILLISWPIVPHVPYEEKKVFFQAVYKSVKKIKNAKLIIKPHPNESPEALRQHTKIWGMSDAKVIQTINLLEVLAVSDVMVMIWSMAAFEAIAMNVPVIAVNFAKKDYDKHIPYAKQKGVIQVTTQKELYEEMKKLLQDSYYLNNRVQEALNFGQKYFGPLDGKTAERIDKLIES